MLSIAFKKMMFKETKNMRQDLDTSEYWVLSVR